MSKPDVVFIDNVDQIVTILKTWHQQRINILEHLLTVPKGIEMQISMPNEKEPINIKLEGDVHQAFIAGISIALTEFITLPFVAEIEDNNSPTLDNPIH